jgi:UrcA family protein
MTRTFQIGRPLLALAAALVAAPLLADSPMTVTGRGMDDPYTIRVAYGDLNLANAADADALRARVERAAKRTCGAYYGDTTPSQRWQCLDVVEDVAAPQIAAAIDGANRGIAQGRAVTVRFARR